MEGEQLSLGAVMLGRTLGTCLPVIKLFFKNTSSSPFQQCTADTQVGQRTGIVSQCCSQHNTWKEQIALCESAPKGHLTWN